MNRSIANRYRTKARKTDKSGSFGIEWYQKSLQTGQWFNYFESCSYVHIPIKIGAILECVSPEGFAFMFVLSFCRKEVRDMTVVFFIYKLDDKREVSKYLEKNKIERYLQKGMHNYL